MEDTDIKEHVMKKIVYSLIIVIASVVVAAHLFFKRDTSTSRRTIDVGAIFILSGSGSELGQQGIESLEVAKTLFERAHGQSGTSVRYCIEDSKSSPQGALNAYNSLKRKSDFDFVITHGSFAGCALSEQTRRDGKILLSTGAASDPVETNPFFVVNANDGQVIAEKFHEAISDSCSVMVFYQDDDFGRSVLSSLNSLGRKVIPIAFLSSTDCKTLVASVMPKLSEKMDVIVIGYGGSTVNIMKQLRQNGYWGHIWGSSEIRTPENMAVLKAFPKDVSIMRYFMPDESIRQIYREKFGREELSVADVQTLNAVLLALNAYNNVHGEEGGTKVSRDILMQRLFAPENLTNAPCVRCARDQRIFYRMEFAEVDQ